MATPDLTRRLLPSEEPELMDLPCSYADLKRCLSDIERINRLTFAHRPTLTWLSNLTARLPRSAHPLHIVDVGCGSGGLLRQIHRWASKRQLPVTLTGIDLNPDAVRAAQEATPAGEPIRYLHGNAFSYHPEGGIDIVVSSLLTHHLEEPELLHFLEWMETTTRLGWFINDLHRKPTPYRLFQLLTHVLPLHPFPRNDGLVSIRRSFLLEDWQRLIALAGLPAAAITLTTYRPAKLCVGRVKI